MQACMARLGWSTTTLTPSRPTAVRAAAENRVWSSVDKRQSASAAYPARAVTTGPKRNGEIGAVDPARAPAGLAGWGALVARARQQDPTEPSPGRTPEPGSVHGDLDAGDLTAAQRPFERSVQVVVLELEQLEPACR
jgi:hypothetical protein